MHGLYSLQIWNQTQGDKKIGKNSPKFFWKSARVFAAGKLFQPSLMFVHMQGANSWSVALD
jgi:hypothetical protein